MGETSFIHKLEAVKENGGTAGMMICNENEAVHVPTNHKAGIYSAWDATSVVLTYELLCFLFHSALGDPPTGFHQRSLHVAAPRLGYCTVGQPPLHIHQCVHPAWIMDFFKWSGANGLQGFLSGILCPWKMPQSWHLVLGGVAGSWCWLEEWWRPWCCDRLVLSHEELYNFEICGK